MRLPVPQTFPPNTTVTWTMTLALAPLDAVRKGGKFQRHTGHGTYTTVYRMTEQQVVTVLHQEVADRLGRTRTDTTVWEWDFRS